MDGDTMASEILRRDAFVSGRPMALQALFACAKVRAAFDSALQAIVDGQFWDREVILMRTDHSVGFAQIKLGHEVKIRPAIAWVDVVNLL